MNKKVLLIAGIIILIVSLIIDYIGLGINPGFGAGQITGAIIGIALILYALFSKKLKK
jgi:hypothetical protein